MNKIQTGIRGLAKSNGSAAVRLYPAGKKIKRNTGGVSFYWIYWIGIQNAMPYSQKYALLFLQICRLETFLCNIFKERWERYPFLLFSLVIASDSKDSISSREHDVRTTLYRRWNDFVCRFDETFVKRNLFCFKCFVLYRVISLTFFFSNCHRSSLL